VRDHRARRGCTGQHLRRGCCWSASPITMAAAGTPPPSAAARYRPRRRSARHTPPRAPPVPGRQRQPGQHPYRPVRAQHRIGQLEQLIPPAGQAPVELAPEPRQRPPRPACFPQLLAIIPDLCHTGTHGHLFHRNCVRAQHDSKRWPPAATTPRQANQTPAQSANPEVKTQAIGTIKKNRRQCRW
jgi:hypothetical protein